MRRVAILCIFLSLSGFLIVKGFNTGADDFITKPIIMEKLLSCVITQMQLVEATRK